MAEKRTVLLTGGSGFVGQALAKALAARGDRVIVTSRDPDRARRAVPEASTVVARADAAALRGVSAVVNLAGEPVAGRWSASKKQAIEQSRVDGTRAIARAIGELPVTDRPRVLVSASAIGYYGDRGEEILEETSAAGGDLLAGVCLAWEGAANEARESGVRVVTPRIGLVMGDGGALAAMRPLFAMGFGGPLGNGKQWWAWIHLDDVVGLLLLALDREDLEGPLNATAPEPVRQVDHARALGRAMHRPAFVPAPSFALRTVLGDFSVELLASRRVVPSRALSLGFAFRHPRVDEALADVFRK